MKTISIFCGSKDSNNNETIKLEIYKVLSHINPNQFSIAYGGGTRGYMGDIYYGCKEKELFLISINCEKWKEQINHSFKNYREYFHKSLHERQNHLLFVGDIYIVLPGGVGTIFEAMQAIVNNDIKETNKPIYFLNINNYFELFFKLLDHGREQGTINKSNEELNIIICKDSKELLEKLN
jgi:uncharacterized protein (TIGR00730 family)